MFIHTRMYTLIHVTVILTKYTQNHIHLKRYKHTQMPSCTYVYLLTPHTLIHTRTHTICSYIAHDKPTHKYLYTFCTCSRTHANSSIALHTHEATQKYKYAHIHTYTHACTYTFIHVFVCVCVCVHAHVNTRTPSHKRALTLTNSHTHSHTCVRANIRACTHTHIY